MVATVVSIVTIVQQHVLRGESKNIITQQAV